jgi:hypothetical protein
MISPYDVSLRGAISSREAIFLFEGRPPATRIAALGEKMVTKNALSDVGERVGYREKTGGF